MAKLRMKDTPTSVEAAVLKAERRAKRKRATARPRLRSESLTPPRSRPHPLPTDDLGFDESTVPPDQARKRAYREEEEEAMEQQAGSSFADRLRNAAVEDEGVGAYEEMMYAREAAAFSYGGAAGVAMGMSGGGGGGGGSAGAGTGRGMDEEEYAEYVRAGMWRRKNKEEVERREMLERERRVKEEKERVEGEKRRREEKEKIRRLEERRKATSEKDEKDARASYEERWKKLLAAPPPPPTPNPTPPAEPSSSSTDTPAPAPPPVAPLRFTSFPWPLYPPMPLPPLSWPSASQITPTAISTFLLSHLPSSSRKSTLRQAVLAYHPDRFERLVMRVPDDKEGGTETRERVRELGLRTSQVLNDLMKAGGGV